MNKLIAFSFEDEYGANAALAKVDALKENYLITISDAVVANVREDGKVKLNQSVDLVSRSALGGGFWGGLIGLILSGPLGLLLIGGTSAALGALMGSLSDYGIKDDFIKSLSSKLQPGTSALFLLIAEMTEDKVLEEMKTWGGEIIQTSLSKEAEEKLRNVTRKD
ncbi:MAG: DUF1269 domain-containing protein [Bacteroidota bacterium]